MSGYASMLDVGLRESACVPVFFAYVCFFLLFCLIFYLINSVLIYFASSGC